MQKYEQHQAVEEDDAPGAEVAHLSSERMGATRSSRLHVVSAGNVVHMDRKRDERQGQGRVRNAMAEPDTTGASLSRNDRTRMADQIGRQLRGMYDGLLNQPVPDRFMELVQRLERGEIKEGNREK